MRILFLIVVLLTFGACAVSDLSGEKSAPPPPPDSGRGLPIPIGGDNSAKKSVAIAGNVHKGEGLSRAPLAGAKVKILLDEKIIGETATLPSGVYNWSGPLAYAKKYKIRVEYKNSVGEISFVANRPTIDNLDVSL